MKVNLHVLEFPTNETKLLYYPKVSSWNTQDMKESIKSKIVGKCDYFLCSSSMDWDYTAIVNLYYGKIITAEIVSLYSDQ